jgi:YfiH family protein
MAYFQYAQGPYKIIYTTIHGDKAAFEYFNPVLLKQIHSNYIIDIDTEQERSGDGIYTAKRDQTLGIKVADCLPVYLFNDKTMCIIHCGWRGILQGIARNAREIMKSYSYVLGAAIGPCCYEIGPDVEENFIKCCPTSVIRQGTKTFLDLKAAVIQELGRDHLVASLDMCTKCHGEYFYSFRRGDRKKRNYALITRDEYTGDN